MHRAVLAAVVAVLAAAQPAPAQGPFDGLTQVGTRTQTFFASTVYRHAAGGGRTARYAHRMTVAGAGLRLAYGNIYKAPGAAEPDPGFGPGPFDLKAAIVAPSGARLPVTFGGVRRVTLEPGEVVVSDPVDVAWNAGDVIQSRTFQGSAAAGSFPISLMADGVAEGVVTGDHVDDTHPIGPNTQTGHGPIGLLTDRPASARQVGILGDSIAGGQGENGPARLRQEGYILRGLGGTVPFVRFPRTGERVATFLDPLARAVRWSLYASTTEAIVEYGINDVRAGRTAAQIEADLTALWRELSEQGALVFQTTLTPAGVHEDTRVEVNEWIRSLPAPLAGYVDAADAAETGRNSGVWRAGLTAGDIHPNSAGHAALAASLDAASTSDFVRGEAHLDEDNVLTIDATRRPGAAAEGTVAIGRIEADVVCLTTEGARATVVYEITNNAATLTPGGIIRAENGAQRNGRLARRKLDAYKRDGCPPPPAETLRPILSGFLRVGSDDAPYSFR